MVRGPWLQEIDQAEKEIISKLEEEIDGYIKGKEYYISIIIPPLSVYPISNRIKTEIIKRYKEAGWKEVIFINFGDCNCVKLTQ